MNLSGCRLLVIAGTGGIGLETALAFLREGPSVHVCDIDADAIIFLCSPRGRIISGASIYIDSDKQFMA